MPLEKGQEWPYFIKSAVTKAGKKIREENSPERPKEYKSVLMFIKRNLVR
jgi:hypothetical protein